MWLSTLTVCTDRKQPLNLSNAHARVYYRSVALHRPIGESHGENLQSEEYSSQIGPGRESHRSETETIVRRSAHARQTQQQASTPKKRCLPVHIQHNPVAFHLRHGHHFFHCNAWSCVTLFITSLPSCICAVWVHVLRHNNIIVIKCAMTR